MKLKPLLYYWLLILAYFFIEICSRIIIEKYIFLNYLRKINIEVKHRAFRHKKVSFNYNNSFQLFIFIFRSASFETPLRLKDKSSNRVPSTVSIMLLTQMLRLCFHQLLVIVISPSIEWDLVLFFTLSYK